MTAVHIDLAIWLGIQLDDDDRLIERNRGPKGLTDDGSFPDYRTNDDEDLDAADDYLSRFNPRRMQAEVDAKRQRIEHYLQVCEYADPAKRPAQEYVLAKGAVERSLMFDALPFADRPGYRDEWRP